jgi:tetraacyldisaccharide 4'-kinase
MIKSDQKLARAVAWLPAKAYELAVRLRVAAYETEYLKSKKLDATVISVGNLSLGGTGKTPFTAFISRYLKEEDHRVAVLTRGYGRNSTGRRVLNVKDSPDIASASFAEFGDEPLMLAESLPGIPIIIDERRYEAGRWAERELDTEVFVLDDAYQHLALHRDLNILLLDATDPFGGFEMAPFGRLREPLYGMKRADAIIITRADKPFDQGQTGAIIKYSCNERVPVMYFSSSITQLRHLATAKVYDASHFRGWNVAAMCAIGNPQAFIDDVLRAGINIVNESMFRDHHAFQQKDLDEVGAAARSGGADAIVTTEKDAVRLRGLAAGEIPIYAAMLELQGDDEVRLKSMLLRAVTKR